MNQVKTRLTTWVKLDGSGNLSPSNIIQLPFGKKPPKSAGQFRQIHTSYCCNEQSFILFRNSTASANITHIVTAYNAINWTGTLANGGYLMFEIPNSYDMTFSVTVDTPSGRTITTSVVQNPNSNATISAVGGITLATNSFSTDVSMGAQFLVILS